MPLTTPLKIQRKTEVAQQMGICLSTLRTRIIEGLYPPPVSLGARAVGCLAHETDAVIAAIAAGQSENEIRNLVQKLVALRGELREKYHVQ